jgi:hypothetical protein
MDERKAQELKAQELKAQELKAQELKAQEFRDQAKRYRAMARASSDDQTANHIFKLAAELERQARDGTQDE